jgi:FAS-associated factor 2
MPLFVYAETLLIPLEDERESDPDEPPRGYEHEWAFRIVTSYPRREIERVQVGGEGVWEVVKGAGGALFAEKEQGADWGVEASDDEDEEDEEDE